MSPWSVDCITGIPVAFTWDGLTTGVASVTIGADGIGPKLDGGRALDEMSLEGVGAGGVKSGSDDGGARLVCGKPDGVRPDGGGAVVMRSKGSVWD